MKCNRKLDEIVKYAEERRINPRKQNEANLNENARGVKQRPVCLEEIIGALLDALHLLLSMGKNTKSCKCKSGFKVKSKINNPTHSLKFTRKL